MASGNQYMNALFTTFHQFYRPKLLICFKGAKAKMHGIEKNSVAISSMFGHKFTGLDVPGRKRLCSAASSSLAIPAT